MSRVLRLVCARVSRVSPAEVLESYRIRYAHYLGRLGKAGGEFKVLSEFHCDVGGAPRVVHRPRVSFRGTADRDCGADDDTRHRFLPAFRNRPAGLLKGDYLGHPSSVLPSGKRTGHHFRRQDARSGVRLLRCDCVAVRAQAFPVRKVQGRVRSRGGQEGGRGNAACPEACRRTSALDDNHERLPRNRVWRPPHISTHDDYGDVLWPETRGGDLL
jgi:hypothetical protein